MRKLVLSLCFVLLPFVAFGMTLEEYLGIYGINQALDGSNRYYRSFKLRLSGVEYRVPALHLEFCSTTACPATRMMPGTYTFTFKATGGSTTYASGTFTKAQLSGYGTLKVVEGISTATGRSFRYADFDLSTTGQAKLESSTDPYFADVLNPIAQFVGQYGCYVDPPLVMGQSSRSGVSKPNPHIRISCTQNQ